MSVTTDDWFRPEMERRGCFSHEDDLPPTPSYSWQLTVANLSLSPSLTSTVTNRRYYTFCFRKNEHKNSLTLALSIRYPQCLSKTVNLPHYICQTNLWSVTAAFPSSEAFDTINEALNASDADRKDAIKQGNALFAFTLKNKAGETESWHIDLKNKGEVGKGLGEKPTGEIP